MGDTIHKRGGLSVEYAKSGRSSCKACSGAIAQDSVRIGNETKSEYHDGWDMSWYHLKCCNNKWGAPRINSFGEIRDGEMLRWDDQIAIKKMVGEKIDNNEEEKRREKENKDLWSLKDTLEDKVPTKILKSLLEANGFDLGKTAPPARVIHKAADGLLWGIIGPCPECKNANSLRYNGTEYICRTGWISEFTRCEFKGTKGVERYKFVIPADLKKANSYLKDYKYPPGHPTKEKGKDGGDSKEEEKEEEPEEEEEKDDGTPEEEPPVGQELWGMKIAVAGTKKDLGMAQDDVGDIITKHGGEFQDDIYVDTTILVASDEEVKKKKKTKKVQTALKQKLPVLTVEWLTNLTERKEEGIKLRQLSVAKKYIAGDVDYDESKKLGKKYSKDALAKEKAKEEKEAKKEEERKKKEEEEKIKDQELKKKRKRSEPKAGSDILKIDPKALKEVSGNPEILVTYDDDYGYTAYSVMLNVSDIATGTNKFYRMQVIRNKGKKSYWFFISWGRVGTDIGDSKIYKKTTENSAIEAFAQKFFDQTGVQWEDRHKFQKKPGKYFMVELDDGHEDEEAEEEIKKVKRQKQEKSESIPMQVDAKGEHMPSRVQDLINLIFDKEMMKKTLQAMEVDIKKMPLGKISRNQIKEGYRALTELQEILQQTNPPKSKLQDCTNRFYTIIPHDFGRSNPPLIGDIESVKKKIQLMDTLLDIEIANAVMKDADKLDESDPIYKNYKSLKSQIAPLEKGSDLYKLLESYAYNTHDKNYFSTFDFDVVDIFEIQRDGEKDRYQPWKDHNNRVLLWHGSRLTNWVGILSQGLRIAPPEAPKTGYRFGKGVYFADCISKSGSYCFTSNDAPQAVMLLAEVALGNMNELLRDEYMEKAPSGKHCTKALGMAAPNAKDSQKIPNDVTVPAGKIVSTGIKSACSHNEYIIYDVAQINIRYLVRLKFKHKTSFW